MGMGIHNFYSQAVNRDFSRDFQLRVVDLAGIFDHNDNVYITTAVLPGYSVHNIPVPFMGLQFNVPGSAHFPGSDAWAVTFRCDVELDLRERLVNWQSQIFSAFPDRGTPSTGNYAPKGIDSIARLIVHRRDGTPARSIKLVGIWPVALGDIEYDQTGNGTERTMQATLAYQWWQRDDWDGSILP
jgi:hypothetical protein